MSDRPDQLDPLEAALHEAELAERAGVFRATRLDAPSLALQAGSDGPRRRRGMLRWAAVAALVVITVSVWGGMFASQIAQLRARSRGTTILQVASAESISSCLAGPAEALSAACRAFDYDADGDVDMADVSSYQLAYATPRQQ